MLLIINFDFSVTFFYVTVTANDCKWPPLESFQHEFLEYSIVCVYIQSLKMNGTIIAGLRTVVSFPHTNLQSCVSDDDLCFWKPFSLRDIQWHFRQFPTFNLWVRPNSGSQFICVLCTDLQNEW